jgi:endonuclease G, mitochondrial
MARVVRKRKPSKRGKPKATARRTKATSGPSEQALRDYVRANAEYFLKDPNISSIGVGHKVTGGKRSKAVSIQFTVRKKVPDSQIESVNSKPIPKSVVIDGKVVPTDVIERDFVTSYRLKPLGEKSDRKQRRDPVQPGISVAHPNCSAGTLGLIVFDSADGTPYILSNWHVLHTPKGCLGDPIVQPGPADDNRIDENRVGTLVRSHLGVACDAAVARIEGRGLKPDILDLGSAPTKVGHVQLGDHVVKSGRTTDVTYGIVTRVDVVSKVGYDEAGEHAIGGFEIGVDPKRPPSNGEVSMGGDSGSTWLIRKEEGRHRCPRWASLRWGVRE